MVGVETALGRAVMILYSTGDGHGLVEHSIFGILLFWELARSSTASYVVETVIKKMEPTTLKVHLRLFQ